MPGQDLNASNIPGRDYGLMKEPMQLVQPFNAIQFVAWQLLALLTDVDAMAAPAELLVRTWSVAAAAIMSHALREC